MHKECPKCQQILDESVKNCPICSTNVSEIESIKTQEDLSPENDPVTPDPLSKDSSDDPKIENWGDNVETLDLKLSEILRSNLTKPALMSGILLGVLTTLPVVNLACLRWVGGAGILTIYFFRSENAVSISSRMGANLGFLTGLFGAAVWQLLEIVLILISGTEAIQEGMQEVRGMILKIENLPPDSLQTLEQMVELFGNPLNFNVILISLIIKGFICGTLTTLGGVLGANLFGQNKADNKR